MIAKLVFLSLLAQAQVQQPPPEDVPVLPAATPTPAPSAAPPTSAPAKADAPKATITSITKVVGEVGEQFVTSREVKINSAIEQALEQKPLTPDDGYKILLGTERIFPAEVGRVLDEHAVFFEARSLGSTAVQKAEVSKVVTQVEERWANNQAYKDLEVGAEELRKMVEQKIAAREFEKLKSDPALSPVSDDEALTYYKKNRLRFGNLPFSNFSENIKSYLVKTQVEKRLAEWHDVLRRKYKTRNFISG